MSILQKDLDHTLAGLTPAEQAKLKDSTILITGCGGFLGYYFMHFFDAQAEKLGIKKVIGLDNFMLGLPGWIKKLKDKPLFDIKKFDIIKDKIEDVEGAGQADFIIYCLPDVLSQIPY